MGADLNGFAHCVLALTLLTGGGIWAQTGPAFTGTINPLTPPRKIIKTAAISPTAISSVVSPR